MNNQEGLETIWEAPDELWELIGPIILEADPPKVRGRKRADPRQMLNGIIFPLAQRVPMEPIAERTGGRQHNPSHLSTVGGTGCLAPNMERPWWNSAKSWAVWTGNGRRQTGPWARHVLGGSDWTQPNGSRQGWQQAEPACGRTGRPIEHCGCRSQRPRRHVVG